MMTAEKVRLSILQQAIQGKLTKQCHNENAIEHLKRIHAYNKSIQEQDFEIPDNWAWAKLADLTTDDSLNDGNWILSKDMSTVGTINLIQLGSVGDCVFKPKDYKRITEKKFDELQCREIYPGYLLINRLIGDRLLSCILPQIEGRLITAVDVCWVAPQPRMYNLKYIMYMCASPFFQSQVKALGHGTTRFRISKTNLINIAFPYPPIEEQARIVDLFESVEPYLVKCEEAERHLVLLNATFPEMMKKSILQEAVQGKLVPQDPNDEPASLLLKKIAEEKKRLIKEGKIKKDKNTSRIVREGNSWFEFADGQKTCIDEEIPFEIPDNWSWVRLNELGDYKKGPFGSALTKSMFVPAGPNSIKVYEQKNAIQKDWTLGEYYIRKEYYEEKMSGFTVEGGDVIVSCAGTIGETYVMPDDIELGIINQALMRMKVYEPMNVDYFLMYFDYVIKATAREQSKGSAIKNIPPFAIFKRILFPMPPLSEQDRILSRLTEILLEVDKMG